MKKRIIAIISLSIVAALCLGLAPVVCAQQNANAATVPAYSGTYYKGITATSGDALLGQLHDLIVTTHNYYTSYSDCKTKSILSDPGSKSGTVLEFYTHDDITETKWDVSGGWNREHVWPKSLSNNLWKDVSSGTRNGGTDLHHIRPSEKDLNNARGNCLYGEVSGGTAQYASGTGTLGGYRSGSNTNGVFEPLDNVKGDVARIIMYVYTHYNSASIVHGTADCSAAHGSLPITDVISKDTSDEAWTMLLDWNKNDPVDDIERFRNNAVYDIQGNRNPFIDNEKYANAIWGGEPLVTIPLESISFNPSTVTMTVGQTTKLNVVKTPENANANLSWTSSNESVATVSNDGTVTAKAKGTITITAKDADTEKSAAVTVIVKEVDSITISGTAAKTAYIDGDAFDPTGLTVTAHFSDNSTENIPSSQCEWLDGATQATTLSLGTTSVICKYGSVTQTYNGITVSVDPSIPRPIDMTTLAEGVAYKMVVDHKGLGKFEYMTSTVGENYYLGMTEDRTAAPDVFVEKTGSGFYMYFGSTPKKYINTVISGTHVNLGTAETAETLWYYDTTNKCIATDVSGKGEYYLGSFTKNDGTNIKSFRPSEINYIADYPQNVGVSQYVAFLTTSQIQPENSVSLDKTQMTIFVGNAEKLTAKTVGEGEVKFTSSNVSVATVGTDGTVTAVGIGATTITAEFNGKTATCSVTVLDSVSISSKEESILVGGTVTLTATAGGKVDWSSDNGSVATVDAKGVVTGVSEGTANITATYNGKTATCVVTVSNSVTLEKAETEIIVGGTEQLAVSNATGTVVWSSSDDKIVTVANGLLTAVAEGKATVTATVGSVRATCVVTVKNQLTLTSDATVTLKIGDTHEIKAQGTSALSYISSNTSIATVDNNGVVTAVAVGSATITVKCGNEHKTVTVSVNDGTVVEVEKTETIIYDSFIGFPNSGAYDNYEWKAEKLSGTSFLYNNNAKTLQFTGKGRKCFLANTVAATGKIVSIKINFASDRFNQEQWQVSTSATPFTIVSGEYPTGGTVQTAVATNGTKSLVWTIDGNYTYFALSVISDGATYVTSIEVTYMDKDTGPAPTDKVGIDKTDLSLTVGDTTKLNAVEPTGGVIWSSSDTSVATVAEDGTVTAVAKGTATITVTCGVAKAECTVTVTALDAVEIADTEILLGTKESQSLTFTSSGKVTWTSSDNKVATVDETGVVKAVGVGEVTITATVGAATDTCKVTVAQLVTLNKTSLTLDFGKQEYLQATVLKGTPVWTSSNPEVIFVDNNGLVRAVGVGEATITVTVNGDTATCSVVGVASIVLDKETLELIIGETATLVVVNAESSISWSSDNGSVATVDSASGVVTAVAEGTATITAKSADGKTDTCVVTVRNKLSLDKTEAEILVGETVTLKAVADGAVVWSSSNEEIAKVDDKGVVTGVSEGVVKINATVGKTTVSCSVTVSNAVELKQSFVVIKIGSTQQLEAVKKTGDIEWSSSNETIATVDANGKITGVAEGEITVTAKIGKATATVSVKVVAQDADSVILQSSLSVKVGTSITPQYAATGDVVWSVSEESPKDVVELSNGVVKGLKAGKVTIVATCGKETAACEVTVYHSIVLEETTKELKVDDEVKLIVKEATATIAWTSSDIGIATVSADGTVKALKAGVVTITAKISDDVYAECVITIKLRDSVNLGKTELTLNLGEYYSLSCNASGVVTWKSSDTKVVTVSNGRIFTTGVGKATITAVCGEATATCEVTVVSAVQKFVEAVDALKDIGADSSALKFDALKNAMLWYNSLTTTEKDIEREIIDAKFKELQQAIAQYNADVEKANNEMSSALTALFSPSVAAVAFTALAAAVFVLKKRF